MRFPFRVLRFVLPPAVALVGLASCANSEPAPPAPEPVVGVSYTVDGVPAKTSAVGNATTGGQLTSGHYIVNGRFGSDGSGLTLHLPLPLALGTYPLTVGTGGAASGRAGATYWATTAAAYDAVSGSVTLTALDPTSATGTFALTARCAGAACPAGSTRTIANGVFRVRR